MNLRLAQSMKLHPSNCQLGELQLTKPQVLKTHSLKSELSRPRAPPVGFIFCLTRFVANMICSDMKDQASPHSNTRGDTYVGVMKQGNEGMSRTAMILICTLIMLLVAAVAVAVILVVQQKPNTAPIPIIHYATIPTSTYLKKVAVTEPEMTISETKTHKTTTHKTQHHKIHHHKTTTHHKTTKHRTTTQTKESHRTTYHKITTQGIEFTVTSTAVTASPAITKAASYSVNITIIPPETLIHSIENKYPHPPLMRREVKTSKHCRCGPIAARNQTVDSILEASSWSKKCLEELWEFVGEDSSDLSDNSELPNHLGPFQGDIVSYMYLLHQYGFWCSGAEVLEATVPGQHNEGGAIVDTDTANTKEIGSK